MNAEPAPQLTAEELAQLERFWGGDERIARLLATIDSLRTQLAEAQGRETALREALELIRRGPADTEEIPGEHGYTYQLWGDYAEDARYVYPARERWFKATAARALPGEQA